MMHLAITNFTTIDNHLFLMTAMIAIVLHHNKVGGIIYGMQS